MDLFNNLSPIMQTGIIFAVVAFFFGIYLLSHKLMGRKQTEDNEENTESPKEGRDPNTIVIDQVKGWLHEYVEWGNYPPSRQLKEGDKYYYLVKRPRGVVFRRRLVEEIEESQPVNDIPVSIQPPVMSDKDYFDPSTEIVPIELMAITTPVPEQEYFDPATETIPTELLDLPVLDVTEEIKPQTVKVKERKNGHKKKVVARK